MAEIGFDTSTIPDSERSYEALTGWYPAHAIESNYVRKEPGVREYAKFTFEVIEGPRKGAKVWINCMNMVNPSAVAQQIGRDEFKQLCMAAGTGPVSNTSALEFIPVMIRCKADKEDAEKTVIGGFKKYQAGAAQSAAPAQAAAPASPWGKK
jgi:hypothetical protein